MQQGDLIEWTAAILAIAAASMIAAHISRKVTGAAFVIFTVASVLWTIFALKENDHGLLVQNIVLIAINLLGVWRYLFSADKPRVG